MLEKLSPVPARIAGQQRKLRHGCVGADEEVWQHARAASPCYTIMLKHLAREKQRCSWDLCEYEAAARSGGIVAAASHPLNVPFF